jgi:hypothetical protein
MNDVYDLLSRGVDVARSTKKLASHKDDIAAMQGAGFVVQDSGLFIETHACAFKALGRGDYDTISPGTRPDEPNCRAYPRPDGGWSISRYGTRVEQEKPGWTNNSSGFAYFEFPGPKMVIDLGTTPEKEIADKTAQALTQAEIFQRGGTLVQVRPAAPNAPHVLRPPDAPSIVMMPRSAIREAIADSVNFCKFDARKKDIVRCQQPGWLAENIAQRGHYPVPTIESISTVPLFLPSGSILTRPGYDAATGIYYAPSGTVGELVSVTEALAELDDVFADFPFALPAHKSAVFAAVLTLLARFAFPGKAPMFLIEGNRAGTGKGLLADVLAIIGVGTPFARMTAAENDAEMRKRLTSIAMTGEAAILLDNLTGQLKSAALDAALTSDTWADRLLGRNETVRVPMATIFVVTGNNLSLHADTCRRTCHIRLETQLERPELRSDCRHSPLLPYVRSRRGKLTAATLSLLHHYHVARRPDQGLKPWGSFEGWTLIRNVLVWAGMPDPMETLTTLREQNDSDTPILRMLLDGWQEAGGTLTAGEAIEAAYVGSQCPTLRAAIEEIEGRDKKQALGITLAKFKGCRIDGRYFDRIEGRITKWTTKVEAA